MGLIASLAFLGATAWGVAFTFARKVVVPASKPFEPLQVISVQRDRVPQTITVTRGEDSDLSGEFSFVAENESVHVRVGDVVARTHRSVEREILAEFRNPVRVGHRGRITGWWYDAPEELGYPVEHVAFSSSIGELPAWLIRSGEKTPRAIAIHVHGRGARREEVLRGVHSVAEAGWENLVVTYRNDPEAPHTSSRRYGLGVTESLDVEAAIRYAASLGATSLLLVGWSMGGSAVVRAAERTEYRGLLRGLILESPALDWLEILEHQARRAGLPRGVTRVGIRLLKSATRPLGLERPLDVRTLTADRVAASLRVPTLIHASDGDTFVPNGGALRLAHLRKDLVTLRNVSEGEHVKIWNLERAGWHVATRDFARSMRTAERG